jgi:SSS family solute:Na+ symporter
MVLLDWIIVGLFFMVSLGIGLYFTRRASKGKDDFFLAGRSLGWFVAGTSIVATTFSSDTPQWVAGWSRSQGISGNWLWWCAGIGQIGAIFFLARYWRRSEVVTEVDFVRLRYGENNVSDALRIFKVFFDGILVNCTIMASVTLAMAKVATIVLELSTESIFTVAVFGEMTWTGIILVMLTMFILLYCTLSGLYGVVYTDLFQFFFAMVGTIALAVIMYVDASRGQGIIAKLEATPQFNHSLLDMIPDLTVWNAATLSFILYIGVVWWLSFPTGGFHVQRLLSTKNEKEAMKAFLWYNFANYVLRSWPWIVVGILAIIYYPNLENPENSYAMAIADFLPVGLKGIMVAAFMAAYMSTISTHLNWGTSYLVNDFYNAFINPNASQRRIVAVSRICMVALAIFAAIIATKLTMMIEAYKFLTMLWAGVGTILIARWYWWRITAAAEFLALAVTVLFTALLYIPQSQPALAWVHEAIGLGTQIDGLAIFCIRVSLMSVLPPLFWLPYVLFTSQKPSESAVAFYRKIRISSPGWRLVERQTGQSAPRGEFIRNFIGWVVTSLTIYGLMLGIGSIIFHDFSAGIAFLAVAAISGYTLKRIFSKIVTDVPNKT